MKADYKYSITTASVPITLIERLAYVSAIAMGLGGSQANTKANAINLFVRRANRAFKVMFRHYHTLLEAYL